MKHILSSAVLAGVMLAGATQAMAATGQTCLVVRDITSSDANRAGTEIIFKMRNGKVYRNILQGPCPDLQFEGFAWTIHNETVCGNSETLRVLHSGEICQLGKFTEITPAPKS